MPFIIEPLAKAHDRSAFDCGEPALNEYLRRYARQNQDLGYGRVYVAVPVDSMVVAGYYSIAADGVSFEHLPAAWRKGAPRYPVPILRIGRLATDRAVRGQRLGNALLYHAFQLASGVAEIIGVRAIAVDAKTETVARFYRRFGFEALPDRPLQLFLAMDTVRQVVGD